MPANMETVIDQNLAEWLSARGYFYVMHRFNPNQRFDFVQSMQQKGLIASISLGITEDEYQLIDIFKSNNITPEYITIDVAHGHSDYVFQMVAYIKEKLPETFLIGGNMRTPEAIVEAEAAGVDAIKVGIDPGKACITKDKTGFGTSWGSKPLSRIQDSLEKTLKAMEQDLSSAISYAGGKSLTSLKTVDYAVLTDY